MYFSIFAYCKKWLEKATNELADVALFLVWYHQELHKLYSTAFCREASKLLLLKQGFCSVLVSFYCSTKKTSQNWARQREHFSAYCKMTISILLMFHAFFCSLCYKVRKAANLLYKIFKTQRKMEFESIKVDCFYSLFMLYFVHFKLVFDSFSFNRILKIFFFDKSGNIFGCFQSDFRLILLDVK